MTSLGRVEVVFELYFDALVRATVLAIGSDLVAIEVRYSFLGNLDLHGEVLVIHMSGPNSQLHLLSFSINFNDHMHHII